VQADERQTITLLLQGDEATYERVYKQYFQSLYAYAYSIIEDVMQAEEIVQQLFLKIWEKKENIHIETSLQAYLYKSVYFQSLNYIKHLKVRNEHQKHTVFQMKQSPAEQAGQQLDLKLLESRFRKALSDLPEQCRTVFQLSRFEELKYREIAGRLGISEKTVEHHMGKALRVLRTKLAEFLVSILLLLSQFKELFR
jgi:RNA polymerase sigma-70 factor (ECF subfamily)